MKGLSFTMLDSPVITIFGRFIDSRTYVGFSYRPKDIGLHPQPVSSSSAKTKVKSSGKPASRDTTKQNDLADTRFSIVIGKGGE